VRVAEREAGAPPAATSSRGRPWAPAGALAVLCLVALDVAAVPVVLPSARVELGTSSSGLLWMQDAYLLALAVGLVLLLEAGAALDRRIVVAGGAVAFMGGALLASTGDGSATLVAGRALQGLGGAALLLAAIERLPRGALVALAVAPLLGGAVAEAADWRWLFRLELVAALPAALLLVPGRRGAPRGERSLRGGRAAALAAGLVLAVTGLIQSGPWGWGSADTLLVLAAGAALLAYAWRDGLSDAEAAAFTVAGSLCVALLLAPQYFELVRGLSPLRAGLLTAALTLPAATLALLAGVLASRVPGRLLMAGGLGGAALGAFGMTRIDPASSYAVVILSLALLGAAAGTAAGALARGRRAVAADLVAAAAGAALVLAAAGAVFQRAQLDERDSGGSFEDALAAGVAGSAWLLVAILAAAALLAWRRARDADR
jgi:Major Facilitator Superfamily